MFLKTFFKTFFKNWASFKQLNKTCFSKTLSQKKFRKKKFVFYNYVNQVILEDNLLDFFKKKSLKKFPYYTAKIFIVKFSS